MLIELSLYVFALILLLCGSALLVHAATSLAREFRDPRKALLRRTYPRLHDEDHDRSNRAA